MEICLEYQHKLRGDASNVAVTVQGPYIRICIIVCLVASSILSPSVSETHFSRHPKQRHVHCQRRSPDCLGRLGVPEKCSKFNLGRGRKMMMAQFWSKWVIFNLRRKSETIIFQLQRLGLKQKISKF